MKKNYFAPQVVVEEIAVEQMIALSPEFSDDPVDPTTADSKEEEWAEWDESIWQ